jgi:hypothetical protein
MGIDLLSVMSGLSGAGQGILAAQDRKVALDRQAKMDAMAQAELQTKQANFKEEMALKSKQAAAQQEYYNGMLTNKAQAIENDKLKVGLIQSQKEKENAVKLMKNDLKMNEDKMSIQLDALKAKWKGVEPEKIFDEVKKSEYNRDKALATQLTDNLGQLKLLNNQFDRAIMSGSGLSIEDITAIASKNAAFQSMANKLVQPATSSNDPFSDSTKDATSTNDTKDPFGIATDLTNIKEKKSKASSDAISKAEAGSVGFLDLVQKGGENLYGNAADLFDIFSDKVKKGKKYIFDKARASEEKTRALLESGAVSPNDFLQ